jgi:two-component system LytT family sensor kinase
MRHHMPEYLLISELLGFGTGCVLSILLLLLARRTAQRSPGSSLLGLCALLWNVFGFLMILLVLAGMSYTSLPVNLVRATYLSAGALFPVSFLRLWARPLPEASWQSSVNRWLNRIANWNGAILIVLLFACPFAGSEWVRKTTSHCVSLNASILLTIGALTLVRGRLRVVADRIYLTLTLLGLWASTVTIFTLEQFRVPARLEAFLMVTAEQSPFLAVLGAMFFFARFRSSDVLIKSSLRVVAAVCLGLWTYFFIVETLPGLAARVSAYPGAARIGFASGLVAGLLVLFCCMDQALAAAVDTWVLRQPDYRATLRQLWRKMSEADTETELFAKADRVVSETLDVSAAVILRRAGVPVIEPYAESNVGQLWEIPCDDACRRLLLPGYDVDVVVPVRVHGEITHVMAVAPGDCRRNLLHGELEFLENVAGQVGSRLESMQHEREMVERQSREATLRELAAQAELKALRAQINPHFLFNSLNTIADLIVTDPAKAEAMTVLLAKVFRHVLMHSDQQLTRVAEEMDFLRTYLRIEEVRFGPRLRVRMDVDPAVSEDEIPSLILQPVVENAIKHGLAPKVGDGQLSIRADRHGEFVRLAVEDDGVGASPAAEVVTTSKGSGVGLKIIADRLRTLYHDRASLQFETASAAGSRVTILIPRSEAV